MRIQSGITDQVIYFVAVDSADYVTRETGITGWTVYRSRNGGAATAFTTPTVSEVSSANMPGVYSLLLDEDMTIDSGDDSQAVVLHITATGVAPITLMYELYRPTVSAGQTLTVTSGRGNADLTHIATAAVSTSTAQLGVNVVNFGGAAGTFASGRPEVNTSHISGSAVSTSAAQIGVNVVNAGGTAWASGSLTSGVFASGAITATAIAADAIGASELAADAVTEIVTGVWNAATATYGSAGSYGELIETNLNATVSSRASQTSVDTIDDFLDTEISTLITNTNNIETDTQDIQTRLPAALVSGRIDASVGAMAANVMTAAATAADYVTELQSGLSTLTAGAVSTAVWDAATASYGSAGTYGALVETNLDAAISTRLASASYTAPLDAAGTRSAIGLATANLDTQLTAIDDYLDTELAAVKAKTDQLTFTVAGQVDSNVQYVNDVQVTGTGANGDEWGPV